MIGPLKLWKTEKLATEIQKDIDGMNKTNWKTNTFGLLSCVLAIGLIWAPKQYVEKIMNTQTQLGSIAALVGVTAFAAKDHDN